MLPAACIGSPHPKNTPPRKLWTNAFQTLYEELETLNAAALELETYDYAHRDRNVRSMKMIRIEPDECTQVPHRIWRNST